MKSFVDNYLFSRVNRILKAEDWSSLLVHRNQESLICMLQCIRDFSTFVNSHWCVTVCLNFQISIFWNYFRNHKHYVEIIYLGRNQSCSFQ